MSEDIFLWPDGYWCYREDLEQGCAADKSDDYQILPFNSAEYNALRANEGVA